MKPCSKNRKLIAWLALDALDARQAHELRAHIETCHPCRRYLGELAAVKNKLSAAESTSDIQASASFHRKLAARLRAEQPRSLWDLLTASLAAVRLTWRVALPAGAAAAVVIVGLASLVRQPNVAHPVRVKVQAALPVGLGGDLSPTVSNYQRAAGGSLDELEEMLTVQARKPRSPAAVYTASIFASAHALD